MKNKTYQTFDEAVADIPDGSVFMSAGFGGVGVPRNILAAVHRQGAKNLTGISNNGGTLDAKVDVGTLIAAGPGEKKFCAFPAPTPPSPGRPLPPGDNQNTKQPERNPPTNPDPRDRAPPPRI